MIALYFALFLSGAAALIYQSTWGRMLQRVFGVSDLAIATVLATFFLGLGIGSALGGRFGTRSKRPAWVYAGLEIGVGVWALASILLIPRIHGVYAGLGGDLGFGMLTFVRFLLAIFVLLPPTILMGATLPVLIRAVSRQGVSWASGATFLYATNTIGAVAGAGFTGLWLVPEFGAEKSVLVAAILSFSAAAIVATAWARKPTADREAEVDFVVPFYGGLTVLAVALALVALASKVDWVTVLRCLAVGLLLLGGAFALSRRRSRDDASPTLLPPRPRLAMTLAMTAGFASLAGEVLWTRVLRLVVQGTTQAFAAMLVNFLFGIALGSLIADRLARRFEARVLFGITQALLGVLTVGAIVVASHIPQIVMLIQGEIIVVPHHAWVIMVASAVLLMPIAITLGTSIPLAWRIAGGTPEQAAIFSGRVLAANTLGGLLGSLAAGFLLVPIIGVEASLVAVAFIHFITASIALRAGFDHRGVVAKVLAITLPLMVAVGLLVQKPSLEIGYLLDAWYDPNRALIDGPNDLWRDNLVFMEEGRNTTVTIIQRSDDTLRLFNDGRPESGIGLAEPGFGEELATLGSLPVLLAEPRERAMVVGLGAAHSTAVLLGGPWERVDVVELESAVVGAARKLYEARTKEFPLDDERARLIVDDARAQLVLSPPDTYDAIVSQPSHPWLAGSSALYTREFFEESRRALRDGGILALWSNLFRMDLPHLRQIVRTLTLVFEHVHAYVCEDSSMIFAASDSPIGYGQEFATRVSSEGLRPYLRPFALDDLVDFVGVLELDDAGTRAFAGDAEPLVDDRPALEFALARIPHSDGLRESQLDWGLAGIPWMTPETFATIPEDFRVDVLLQRIDYATLRHHAIERVILALPELPLSDDERRLVEGVLAERRGDVAGAIAAWRDSNDSRARYRLTELLDAERLWSLQLEVAREWEEPEAPARMLRAAMALRDRAVVAETLATTEAALGTSDAGLLAVARAFSQDDCAGLLTAVDAYDRVLDDEHATLLAVQCAFSAGDVERAEAYDERRYRARRALAAEAARAGAEADQHYNGGLAMRLFRRALWANPAQAPAASGLARRLVQLDRREEAARVLRDSRAATRGLPSASQTIEGVIAELEIEADITALSEE